MSDGDAPGLRTWVVPAYVGAVAMAMVAVAAQIQAGALLQPHLGSIPASATSMGDAYLAGLVHGTASNAQALWWLRLGQAATGLAAASCCIGAWMSARNSRVMP